MKEVKMGSFCMAIRSGETFFEVCKRRGLKVNAGNYYY